MNARAAREKRISQGAKWCLLSNKTTECLVNSYLACRTGGLAGQRAKRDTPTWSATTSGRVETKVVALRTRVSRFAFSPVNSPVFQANSHLIETARVYFVLTSYQKSAGGVITYQLLTRCSIDSINCSSSSVSSQAHIYCNLEGIFFQQLNCQMALDVANSDASSATVRVLVSFYLIYISVIYGR